MPPWPSLVQAIALNQPDLAAVEIENQVQIKPASLYKCWQERHVPAPDVAGAGCDVGCRRAGWLRRARSASVSACVGVGRSAPGRRSPWVRPSPACQWRKVPGSMPANSHTGSGRAPWAQACFMSFTRVWRSSRRVVRPRLSGRPPRVFLTAQARRPFRPTPCPCGAVPAPVP